MLKRRDRSPQEPSSRVASSRILGSDMADSERGDRSDCGEHPYRGRGEGTGSGVLECRLSFGNESRLKNPSRTQWRRIFFASAFAATAPSLPAVPALTAAFSCRHFAPQPLHSYLPVVLVGSLFGRYCFDCRRAFAPADKAPLIRPDPRPAPRLLTCAQTLDLLRPPRRRCENERSRHPSGCRLLA